MRVAIILNGHLRSFKRCYESFLMCVAQPTKADVFLHTWDFELQPVRGNDAAIQSDGTIQEAIELYKPVSYCVEKYTERIRENFLKEKFCKAKHPHMSETNRGVENCMAMYYSIKKSFSLCSDYAYATGQQYDAVIRCRTDLEFGTQINLDDLIESTKTKKIFFPNFEHHSGLNDQFAFGAMAAIRYYSDVQSHFDRYVDEGCFFNPEFLLKHHMDRSSYEVATTDIVYQILR